MTKALTYHGKPCPRDRTTRRYLSSNNCVQCHHDRKRESRGTQLPSSVDNRLMTEMLKRSW